MGVNPTPLRGKVDGGNHCVLWVSVPHHPLVVDIIVGLNTLLVSRQQAHCEVQTFRQIAGSQLLTMASEGYETHLQASEIPKCFWGRAPRPWPSSYMLCKQQAKVDATLVCPYFLCALISAGATAHMHTYPPSHTIYVDAHRG